jgi:hypothetical protein
MPCLGQEVGSTNSDDTAADDSYAHWTPEFAKPRGLAACPTGQVFTCEINNPL